MNLSARYRWLPVLLVLFFLLEVIPAQANTSPASRADEAVHILAKIEQTPDKSIPNELLQKAHAIAVLPNLVSVGLVFGGRFGKGLISVKRKDGSWSNPNFIKMAGASVGFQIGVSSSSLVLVFTTKRGVDSIVNGKFTIGVDANIAAGPVGRNASASTDAKLHAEIYSYSRSRGLFAGISLHGGVISIDEAANAAMYGAGITPRRIVEGGVRQPPSAVNHFREALEKYSAR